MSRENVELVRVIFERWKRGEYSATDWADPNIEFVMATPGGGSWRGVEAMQSSWRDFLHAWQDFRGLAERIIDVGDHVLVYTEFGGSGRGSGVPIRGMRGAALFTVEDGRVVKLALFTDRDEALEAAGLSE
jgi:ketosteroid isomerase-like protein